MRIEVDDKDYFVDFAHCGPKPDCAGYYACATPSGQGSTACWLYEDTQELREAHKLDLRPPPSGMSFCRSSDQFRKTTGRKLAFARAIVGFSRVERAKFWEAYFKAMPKDKVVR